MATLNTTIIETVIQNKINQLSTSSSVVDIVLPVTTSNLDIGLTSSVGGINDLPDIAASGLLDGHVVFVRDIKMHVVVSQGAWLSFDGRVYKYATGSSTLGWGSSIYGQLGNNSIVNKSSPVSIAGGFTDWCQVSSGCRHTAAVRTNGTVWAWGNNKYGQLGNNNAIIVRSSPVSVVGGFTDWCQVSAGSRHTAAVRTTGSLWTWGNNGNGQLGDNTTVNKSSPVQVIDKIQVSAGLQHTAAIGGGSIWAWGSGQFGQLGDNTALIRSSPVSVVGFKDWIQVSVGNQNTAGIRSNGTLWAWGTNTYGKLGDNTTVSRSSPVSVVGGFTNWCQVSAGSRGAAAIRTDGTLWAWGGGALGRLGDNTIVDKSSPVQVVGGFTDWCQVSAGGSITAAAVRTNGTLWAWGYNGQGQLGDNSIANKSSPVSVVGGFTNWCQVAVGIKHMTAIRTNGTLWTWGYNNCGQLGDNTIISKRSPVSVVGGFLDWCQVSAGGYHNVAVRTNGTLWAWGRNSYGQLGDNTIVAKSSPVQVVGGFTDWCRVSTNEFNTAAVRTNGTIWAWGINNFGQLGDNTIVRRSSPVSVVGGVFFPSWCRVSAGNLSTAAIRSNSTLWTWGPNNFGMLGDNTEVAKSSPVPVAGGFTDWCAVSTGIASSMAAIRTNGTIWAWGINNFGQLGDNTIVSRSSPVSVVGGFTDWCQIASSGNTAAIRTNGTLWTWGRNDIGQLGDDTIVNKSSPVQIVGGFTNWCQVAANASRITAIRTNGTLWAWGDNSCGQLGDNTIVNKSSPVSVVGGFTNWCQVSAGGYHTAAIRINT